MREKARRVVLLAKRIRVFERGNNKLGCGSEYNSSLCWLGNEREDLFFIAFAGRSGKKVKQIVFEHQRYTGILTI